MPQQLLITLPTKASTWVKLHHRRKAKEGAPLWEDVTKIFEGKALPPLHADELQGESFKDEVTPGLLTAGSQELLTFKDVCCGLHSGGVGTTGSCSPESYREVMRENYGNLVSVADISFVNLV
ncbi:zinc finger protein 69 homolog [Sciurus carolinensis]|uniref:zinc finger protein 69 homolog n=1 Tax=Sciurus carolinensis TaxID=30640 RepID=UPI001FB4CED7|nr:zinc finger protein 69 homolog [Sciurus carolinensis]